MKIVLPREIADELSLYVEATELEISGLGSVTVTPEAVRVTGLHLFKQQCSVGGTELNQGAIADFLLEAVEAGVDTGVLKLHWHSHGRMSVFWSKTDEDLLQGLSSSWMVGVVTNRKGEFKGRLEMRVPFELSVDVPVEIERNVDLGLLARIKAEVAKKVSAIKVRIKKKGKEYNVQDYRRFIMSESDVIIGSSIADEDFVGPVTREYLKSQGDMYDE